MDFAILCVLVLLPAFAAGNILERHERQVTHEMFSRTNDAAIEPPRRDPLNRLRIRYILHAFYLEANMHSEVFSLFESLLSRLNRWIDEKKNKDGGFSMNNLHEMMTLCRRAADELQVLSDYQKREGIGQQDQPIGLVAVIPAVVATLGVPQRIEIIRQLETISPEHKEIIRNFAEYIRIFAQKPWKAPESKSFRRCKHGPLCRRINKIIDAAADNRIGCAERERVGSVDRIVQGLSAALKAAMFTGQCAKRCQTLELIERFAEHASTIHIPKVVLEKSRPLSAVRFEVLQYITALPKIARPLLHIVTRAVNEKMSLREIAGRVKRSLHPKDRLLAPVVLAPLALVSSLHQVLGLATIVSPRSPRAFRLIVAAMFASLQAGSDYFKLAEQIDHEQAMYDVKKMTNLIAQNLSAFYSRTDIGKILGGVEPAHERSVSSALRKGFKALAWNSPHVPRKGHPILDCLAVEARSFRSEYPVAPQRHVIDYWHALNRYILPAQTPFQEERRLQHGKISKEYLREMRDKLAVHDYALLVTLIVLNDTDHELLDRADQILAYETMKIALVCSTSACSLQESTFLPTVTELLSKEYAIDKVELLKMLLQNQKVVQTVRQRLAHPDHFIADPRGSVNCIKEQLLADQARLRSSDDYSDDGDTADCPIVDDALQETLQEDPISYLHGSSLLLHDLKAGSLGCDLQRHLPAALLALYLNSSQSVRNKLLVHSAFSSGRKLPSWLRLEHLKFVNRLAHLRLQPPPSAVQYVKERLEEGWGSQDVLRMTSIAGLKPHSSSRFVRLLKRQIVEEAMRTG